MWPILLLRQGILKHPYYLRQCYRRVSSTVCDLWALLPVSFLRYEPCYLYSSYGMWSMSPVTCVLLTVCDLWALLPVSFIRYVIYEPCYLCPSYGMSPVTCVLLTVCDLWALLPVSFLRYVIYEPCYLRPSYGMWSMSPVTCVLLTVRDLWALLPEGHGVHCKTWRRSSGHSRTRNHCSRRHRP